MSDADWDADDFEPQLRNPKPLNDKWDGEDEEDDIKDSWDKESEEEDNDSGKGGDSGAIQIKKKKKINEILAEREAAKTAKLEAKHEEEREAAFAETPEGKAQEKLRLLQLEEKNNLELAKDMLGVEGSSSGIDGMNPSSKEDFAQFEKALVEKVSTYASSDHFNDFLEGLVRNLCVELTSAALKKMKITVDALHSAKLKEEKAAKNKKKPTVKMDLRRDIYDDDGTYDMDDFM